ncbi:MAG: NAD-binding protein [Candidatus Bathyarchaeales archaeon]
MVIIGGGLVGCELAIKLSNEGSNVTLIEALPQIAIGEPILSRMGIIKLLNNAGVKVLTCAPVVEIQIWRRNG